MKMVHCGKTSAYQINANTSEHGWALVPQRSLGRRRCTSTRGNAYYLLTWTEESSSHTSCTRSFAYPCCRIPCSFMMYLPSCCELKEQDALALVWAWQMATGRVRPSTAKAVRGICEVYVYNTSCCSSESQGRVPCAESLLHPNVRVDDTIGGLDVPPKDSICLQTW